jgi:metallophosphoesterase (TIGR00282 family)
MNLKILFFGDISGRIGRTAVAKILPSLKKKFNPDLVIANAENIAHGVGVTEKTLQELTDAGVDFFTSGDHIFDKKEAIGILEDKNFPLIRPANYPAGVPGVGVKLFEVGTKKVLMINLIGRVFLKKNYDCPFKKADEILDDFKNEKLSAIIVDFHAEATSEKNGLARYLDGRVSAVLGTHTHVGTDDWQILPGGTAFVTDIGMVGAKDSILGVDKKGILRTFLTQISEVHEIPEEGICAIDAIYLEINPKTAKAVKIKKIKEEIKI